MVGFPPLYGCTSKNPIGPNANSLNNMVAKEKKEDEWELRPGGMLVQKRSPHSKSAVTAITTPIPSICVKVKYDSWYHEIYLSSQSDFGELKKRLWERTGVHHLDQKIMYKDKERDSSAFLDTCGVKNKSKLVMIVDPTAQAKRLLEMQKAATLEKATKSIMDIRGEVDKLALQLSGMEKSILNGNKVADKEILNLIEQLMTQLIKLDGVIADGAIKMQRRMQVRRVQQHIETLDMLKIKNSNIENFDSTSTSISTSTRTPNSTGSTSNIPRSKWELF